MEKPLRYFLAYATGVVEDVGNINANIAFVTYDYPNFNKIKEIFQNKALESFNQYASDVVICNIIEFSKEDYESFNGLNK